MGSKLFVEAPKTDLQSVLRKDDFDKVQRITHPLVHRFIAQYIDLCQPSSVYVCTDSEKDVRYTKNAALKNHEEASLSTPGHTVHFDGYYDQARDKEQTKFLLSKDEDLGPEINAIDRQKGLKEIHSILKGSMGAHELFVKFYTLGPRNSVFTISCLQLTDSAYVAHSEDLLYRQGYQQFVQMKETESFFTFIHSQGSLQNAGLNLLVSKKISKRRVYIDLLKNMIFSANTQYGGNTIGLKKLAMRLAIDKASKEGWLTEHMLIMGIQGDKGKPCYVTGAFPSMCGKTSTAMLPDESIVGDDIAYLRNIKGELRAVNVEKGMFGIIDGINAKDDPLQWKALHEKHEIIFSNILVLPNKTVYWNGKENTIPSNGVNYAGRWVKAMKDEQGNNVHPSHKNARFTFDLGILDNIDSHINDPNGVAVEGIIYGGRDSNTWVPVEEAFSWNHGILTKGASLESETTAATLGTAGMRVFNPMSNLDFLSIPIGQYVKDNLSFGKKLEHAPKIFSVNYFLKNAQGDYLNHKNDKRVWLKWIRMRVRNQVEAWETPTGHIPKYGDIKTLFLKLLNRRYTQQNYEEQFLLRIPENMEKIKRIQWIYKTRVKDAPVVLFKELEAQYNRLHQWKKTYGNYVPPPLND